jgi:Ca-activated chloride channel family protein
LRKLACTGGLFIPPKEKTIMIDVDGSNVLARSVEESIGGALPLTGLSITATLAGPFLSAVMIQRWTNSDTRPVEALWRFPVPQGATVRGLVIEKGGRRLVAEIRARDEAFDQYDRGMDDGRLSALLDAETEGLLAMRLGNLAPGESVLVQLSWVSMVEELAGRMRLSLPTAMAPRYFPASYHDDDTVSLQERLDLPWAAKVPYGISVAVEFLDADAIAKVSSPSHTLEFDLAARPLRIVLGGGFEAMDRDFVLDLTLRTDRQARAWMENDGRGIWLAADLRVPEPDSAVLAGRRVAMLLDISGSMQGSSLDAARRAMQVGIASLSPADSFGLYAFNSMVWSMDGSPLAVSSENLAKARSWLNRLRASGGTELLPALDTVFASGDWTDVLVLTDGDVGNDRELASLAGKHCAAGTRTSLLGIGLSPAMDALAMVARAGGGCTATVHPGERIEERALSLFSKMLASRVDDIRFAAFHKSNTLAIEIAGPVSASAGTGLHVLARVDASLPAQPQAQIQQRLQPEVPDRLEFHCTLAGQDVALAIPVLQVETGTSLSGFIAALWARERVVNLTDRARTLGDSRQLEGQAVSLSIKAGILSTVASMVVVDSAGPRVDGDAAFTEIPVLMPAGYGGEAYVSESMSCYACYSMEASCPTRSSPVPRSIDFDSNACATRVSAPKVHKSWHQAANPDTVLYELLALQVPGGGFGPEDEVLALLGAASLEDLYHALGLDSDYALMDPAAPETRFIALAKAVLAWLTQECAAQAGLWEPLVKASRKLVMG